MSQFEYLNHISFGQYLPTDSIIHRLDPRSKILGYAILILALTLSKQIPGVLAAVILIMLLLLVSKVPITYTLRGLLPPLPFIVLLVGLQLFITPHPRGDHLLFSYGILSISATSLRFAILLLIRFTGLILLLTLVSVTLSTLEMIHGLDQLLKPLNKIGIHTDSAAMVVQIMLRFIPFLAINAEKIAKSQASRGAGWDSSKGGVIQRVRQFLPLIIPLFSVSLQQADTLTNAMLARGYDSKAKRTGLHAVRFTWMDLLFLIFSACAAWLILFPL
jgi:energy-coupling factor transport system permease protein